MVSIGLTVVSSGAPEVESMGNGDHSTINHSAHSETLLLRYVFKDGLVESPDLSMNQQTNGRAARREGVYGRGSRKGECGFQRPE
jgi:hypothetical protein